MDDIPDAYLQAVLDCARADGCTFAEMIARAVKRRHLGPQVLYRDSCGFGATPLAWFEEEPQDYLGILEGPELARLAEAQACRFGWEAYLQVLQHRYCPH